MNYNDLNYRHLKDYIYADRGYIKILGEWVRCTSLDKQCLCQRKTRQWNNRVSKHMWI